MTNEEKIEYLNNFGFTPISENLAGDLKVKCNTCGYEFKRSFSKFEHGRIMCQGCVDSEKIKLLKSLNFIPISNDLANNLKVKCNTCGYEFERSYGNFKKGKIKCPNCINIEKFKFLNSIGFSVVSEDLAKNLKVKCKSCGYIFLRQFNNFKDGAISCPECDKIKKLKLLENIGFTPISQNLDNELKVKCNKCGYEFHRKYDSFEKGYNDCPKCERSRRIKYLNNLGFTLVSGNLNNTLEVKCNKCNYKFLRPYSIFESGVEFCPGCEKQEKLDYLKNLGFIAISENLNHDLEVKCLKCNTIFKRTYSGFRRGVIKCPECEKQEKLNCLHKLGFTPLSENLSNQLTVKCNECGYEFKRSFGNFKKGCILCPKCNPYDSSFEKELVEFIGECKQHNILILNGKEIDIYLPNYKLAIECNGDYWHSEQLGKNQTYHLEKTKECIKQNIQLIHIFESSWIEKKEIWKSILNSKLNRTVKIFARKCILKEVNKIEEKEFLETNHLQGFTGSTVCYGLYYQGKLVQLMSFGKPRFSDKADWELIRLASKLNITVVGGSSRLFKYFTQNHSGTILSYSDNLYSNGGIYKQLGFTFSHKSKPGYFYFKSGKMFNRQQFMKHLLSEKLEIFDPNLTESENMINNGFVKIWDCGQSVWIFK